MAEETTAFVTQISETCGALTLTSVGFAHIYALIRNRHLIESVFQELQEIYPRARDRHYRCQHYFDLAMLIMKIEFVLFMAFLVYYNSAPILLLLWEYQQRQELSFTLQANTWFPWKVHGSAIGFGVAVLIIILISTVDVAFAIVAVHLVCIFVFQLKLHFDGLASQLLNLDSRQPDANQQLRNLIAYHSCILQITEQINHILNPLFMTSLVGSTIAICMTSAAILLLDLASAFKYINNLAAFVLYHFVICYLGTEVTSADY
ncbi:putative odorant receptor 69a [Drosophila rhopaloa]|uniref:Odorant receptor 69a n=1 Tax=Drosophila rhopaloa TaxID=1041015 RepID=A0ABM5I8X7_DRORH|nr:putative odorant receptor 69a [Drosophila rhopaloa]